MRFASSLALASASLILVGQGCLFTPPPPTQDLPTAPPEMMGSEDGMMKEDEGTMMEDDDADGAMMEEGDGEAMMKAELAPYYVAYTEAQAEAAMREGRGVVLYFWASWCPICRAEEPKLKGWIETSELPIAGFRVNYDTEAALKAQYKIPYQHTTVFLNAAGEEVERFSGPVDEATFRAALEKAAAN